MTLIEGSVLSIAIMVYLCIGCGLLMRKVEGGPLEWKLLGPRGQAFATLLMLLGWLPVMLFMTIWQLITGKE